MPAGFRQGVQKQKLVGSLRKSKITSTNGCGSLVDFPGFTGVIAGQNLWDSRHYDSMKIYERNLERLVNKEYFLQVASPTDSQLNKDGYKIPILRFPEIYYCPQCGELDYARRLAKNFQSDKDHVVPLKCNNCNAELAPSKFIIACEDGHLEDFPYAWWVHRYSKKQCDKPKLVLKNIGTSGGLESITIKCETCGATQTMANCLNKDALSGLKCRGRSLWLGKDKTEHCGKNVRTLMTGSNNIYYPVTKSALTIPPWSNDIQKEIELKYDTFKTFYSLGPQLLKTCLNNLYITNNYEKRFGATLEEFAEQITMRFENVDEIITTEKIKRDEYKAFVGPEKNDILFKTESTEMAECFNGLFEQVKLVKRLREVQILEGFHRITTHSESGEDKQFAPLSDKDECWLPANELLGEGIFIEFSKNKVNEWCNYVNDNYHILEERYRKYLNGKNGDFSPAYVLVHTFSHLLIREFSFLSGYDSSSLKEKLYVNSDDTKWMCGLLIYTASSSSDGSLGGLVRLGKKEKLKQVIFSALNGAMWCSNDPICIESQAQGYKSLNYAACHACTLIPEISCINNNILLDRTSIVGTFDDRKKGYFNELINE